VGATWMWIWNYWLGWSRVVAIFKISAVDVAGFIDKLGFLGFFFVVPYVLIVVERITNAVDLSIEPLFNLLLCINCPKLL